MDRRGVAIDGAVVGVLISAGLLEQFGHPQPPGESRTHLVAHVLVVVGSLLPLLLRRRFPFATLVLVAAVIGVAGSSGAFLSLNPSAASAFGLAFAVFNATSYGDRRLRLLALVVGAVATALIMRPWETPVAVWLPTYFPLVVAFAAGLAQARRQEIAALLRRRVDAEQAHRQRLERLQLQQARAALAVELRSLVNASVDSMLSHGRRALDLLGRGESAIADLEATERSGRSALAELRVLLSVLRRGIAGGDGAATGDELPVPRVRRLLPSGWLVDIALVAAGQLAVSLELHYWEGALGGQVPPATFSTGAHLWAYGWVALLLLRRPLPFVVGVAMAVMAFLQTYPLRYWTPVTDIIALQVAVYTIASLAPRRRTAWVVAGLGAIGVVSIPPSPVTVSVVGFLLTMVATLAGAAYVGTIVGQLRLDLAELDRHLEALQSERSSAVALALYDEQLRLAREMHDVVAHGVTLMVVQAGAARTVAAADPTSATAAVNLLLSQGEQVGHELDDLLQLPVEGPKATAGHDVRELVDDARRAGLDVVLEQEGDRLPTGTAVQQSVYRIVQESLTNARKYAPGSRVVVRMCVAADKVTVQVVDDGGRLPVSVDAVRGGHGLVGVQERVAMFGGRYHAGPRASGGFALDVELPRLEAAR